MSTTTLQSLLSPSNAPLTALQLDWQMTSPGVLTALDAIFGFEITFPNDEKQTFNLNLTDDAGVKQELSWSYLLGECFAVVTSFLAADAELGDCIPA
jgi:hypothetical protein